MRQRHLPADDGIGIGHRHRIVEAHDLAHAGRQAHRARHAEQHGVEPAGGQAFAQRHRRVGAQIDDGAHRQVGGEVALRQHAGALVRRQCFGEQHAPQGVELPAILQRQKLVRAAHHLAQRLCALQQAEREGAPLRPLPVALHPVQHRGGQRRGIGPAGAHVRQIVPPGGHQQAGYLHLGQAAQHSEDQPQILRHAHIAVRRMAEIDQHAGGHGARHARRALARQAGVGLQRAVAAGLAGQEQDDFRKCFKALGSGMACRTRRSDTRHVGWRLAGGKRCSTCCYRSGDAGGVMCHAGHGAGNPGCGCFHFAT